MLGSTAGPGGPSNRGLWPLAPAPTSSATSFSADGLSKYGVYSLFSGGPTFGSAIYSHASTIGRFSSGHIQQTGNTFHTAHKVSDSLFSATGYTFGAPTPPPGSPYSPIPVAQLELLTKGYSNNSIIIQQQQQQQQSQEYPISPKKIQITSEKRCDEKCCSKTQQRILSPASPIRRIHEITGCSRTNPVEWPGVSVKKEPGTPCQVAEITTSVSPVVKLEVTSPTQKHHETLNIGSSIFNNSGAQIPVGIAVARQRVHQHEVGASSPSLAPLGLLATVNTGVGAQIKEIDNAGAVTSMAAGMSGAAPMGGALLQCGDDRGTGFASWQMGSNHHQTLTTPTVWQYPAQVPMESMVPLSVPTMPPVGFQLVRDPTTGGILLLPTTGLEPLQQTAVVWPTYPQTSSVLLPSLPSMPPPPLQLLSSATSDYLASSTTLHQHHTQTSTRLVAVTTDTKRKIPSATTLIKIETDNGTLLDQTKTLQAVSTISSGTGTVFTDHTSVAPLMTTHLIYQHPNTNLIVSQTPVLTTESVTCRSSAAGLTPPPESSLHLMQQEDEQINNNISSVQDASNQTDTVLYSEDDNTSHTTISDYNYVKEITESYSVHQSEIIREEISETYVNVAEPSQINEIKPPSGVVVEEVTSSDIPMENSMESDNNNSAVADGNRPDLSGLELLSNSIEEFVERVKHTDDGVESSCDVNNADSSTSSVSEESSVSTTDETVAVVTAESSRPAQVNAALNVVDDSLGGLDLLCALAEQRILEENNIEKPERKSKSKHREDKERRREKRKSKKHSSDEPKRKKMKSDKHRSSEERHRSKERRRKEKKLLVDKESQCSCQYKHYKTPESEQEVKKFLESKTRQNFCCQNGTEWPSCMNAMERDMRLKLAELQKEYREKQQELSQLKPKKPHSHHDCSKQKKIRKKSINFDLNISPSSPLLTVVENKVQPAPVEEATSTSDVVKPAKFTIVPKISEVQQHKRRYSQTSDFSPEKSSSSSSKKRKVGRPKRHNTTTGELAETETIVAKKHKSSFVGCLLAAKEKLKQQSCTDEYRDSSSSPPRFIEETYTHKLKRIKNNNNNIINVENENKQSKIRPQLKAEATIKIEDDNDIDWHSEEDDEEVIDHIDEDIVDEIEEEDDDHEEKDESSENNNAGPFEKKEELIVKSSETIFKENNDAGSKITVEEQVKETRKEEPQLPNPCALTDTHLEMDKLRVLTAMGGLFYAGQLNAIEPPDVYSITLDGERGNKPHIMSREEILRDAIVEVAPKSTEELSVGTRLCAYWSQQYRCLYPGSAAEPGTPNPHLDGKFVSVEFDDGDSGKIALQDIRLLPPNYPIIEYDPNPLLSLSKRRRRTSTSVSTDEKHLLPSSSEIINKSSIQSYAVVAEPLLLLNTIITQQTTSEFERYKEKKRLKKKRNKEKAKEFKNDDDDNNDNNNKKKKKKHKCVDEFCKHKKHHKKHKKHRKHHDKSRTGSPRPQFICQIINDDEEINLKPEAEKIAAALNNIEEKENLNITDVAAVAASKKIDDELEEEDERSQPTSIDDDFPNYEAPANPDDEVTMDDILEAAENKKSKKLRDRQESCESRSKMSAFLPARQLWHWSGKGYKRPRAKGKSKKCFYKSVQRGKESITVGDAAVFLSTGRPDRPYIGRIEAMWELCSKMVVKVKWFYHPEETIGCPANLQYPGALFESPHYDENDVQTISHKCEVLPLKEYTTRLGDDPVRYATIYDNNDIYYLAGYYDPTAETLRMEPEIPFTKE